MVELHRRLSRNSEQISKYVASHSSLSSKSDRAFEKVYSLFRQRLEMLYSCHTQQATKEVQMRCIRSRNQASTLYETPVVLLTEIVPLFLSMDLQRGDTAQGQQKCTSLPKPIRQRGEAQQGVEVLLCASPVTQNPN